MHSGREITYIPQSIGDLGNFFVLAAKTAQANPTDRRLFSRTKTTPISTSSVSRSFERATSISESCTGLARDEVQLYLSSNKIRKLPRELFNLTKMTVLSLRRYFSNDKFILTQKSYSSTRRKSANVYPRCSIESHKPPRTQRLIQQTHVPSFRDVEYEVANHVAISEPFPLRTLYLHRSAPTSGITRSPTVDDKDLFASRCACSITDHPSVFPRSVLV